MYNYPFGSKVRAFTQLGWQKKSSWKEGIYIGNNTVEFNNGQVVNFDEPPISEIQIKALTKLPYENCDWPARIEFDQKNWEGLKKIFIVAMERFFPKKEYTINNIEHTLECEGFSICSTVVELESWSSFDEAAVWQISVVVYNSGSRDEPPSEDFRELEHSVSNSDIVRKFIANLWRMDEASYWEDIFYDEMASSNLN